MNLQEQIQRIPFLRLIIPLIIGVAVADMVDVSVVTLIITLGVVLAGVVFLREERVLITALVFIMGMAAVKVNYPPDTVPRNTRIALSCRVEENPITKGRWQQTTATILSYKIYDDSAAVWKPCNEGVMLYVDTAMRVSAGDNIGSVGYLNPLDSINGTSSYALNMRSRGLRGKVYAIAGRVAVTGNTPQQGIVAKSKTLQHRIVERIQSIGLNSKDGGVAMALIAGEKRMLDQDTKQEYSRSGVSHVLAISGLHLGIIFLIINYLFLPLIFVKHGRMLRTALVIATLWGYAFVSGMSASVLRAAFMLSILQLSQMTVWRYNAYNALFGSAFVLILVNPYYIYDISFQMSYLALLSILFFYKRISRWTGVTRVNNYMKLKEIDVTGWQYYLRMGIRIVFGFISSAIIIGIAAQIGVMPLVGYLFGRLPLANLLINPLILIVVALLMSSGFLYIITMWRFLGEIFAWLVKTQNDIVEWASHIKYGSIEGVHFSEKMLYLSYLLMLVAIFSIKQFEKEKR